MQGLLLDELVGLVSRLALHREEEPLQQVTTACNLQRDSTGAGS